MHVFKLTRFTGFLILCAAFTCAPFNRAQAGQANPFDAAVAAWISQLDAGKELPPSEADGNVEKEDGVFVAGMFVKLQTAMAASDNSVLLNRLLQDKDLDQQLERLAGIVHRQPSSCYAACVMLELYSHRLGATWDVMSPAVGVVCQQLAVPRDVRSKEGDMVIRTCLRYLQMQLVTLVLKIDVNSKVNYDWVASESLGVPSMGRRPGEKMSRNDVVAYGQFMNLLLNSGAFDDEANRESKAMHWATMSENLASIRISSTECLGSELIPAFIWQASCDAQMQRKALAEGASKAK